MRRLLAMTATMLVLSIVVLAEDKPRPPRTRTIIINNWGPNRFRPLINPGHNPRVQVQLPSRLDWSYACTAAALATAPNEVRFLEPTQIVYQLWVPQSYRHNQPHPLVLFISAKPFPDEWGTWVDACGKRGILLAGVLGGGNQVHPALRMRLALETFDDLRRRMAIDTDRVYVSGNGEGARTACELAFSYPEFVGGVLAIGGASSPRHEPWMRHRMAERLSVAYVTGGNDLSRREIETFRFPVMRDLGVRTRLWSVPLQNNLMPSAMVLDQALVWLDLAQADRKKLALIAPATRMSEGFVPLPDVWASGVLDEAKGRIKDRQHLDAGLLQLHGIMERWSGTRAAREVEQILKDREAQDKASWIDPYNREQRRFAYLEATGFSDYVHGPLPARDLIRKRHLLDELEGLWHQVMKYGADTDEGREAERRLEQIKKDHPIR